MSRAVRKICVFTATRAEYGLLRPLLLQLRQRENSQLHLVVTGTHLSKQFGMTIKEIWEDGFQADSSIYLDFTDDSPTALCRAQSHLITELSATLIKYKPDIFILLGDRYEALTAALAANLSNIPIVHIGGGEVTQGANDENFRHSITKLSHIHFTSCEPYRQRVIQLGEDPSRVFNVGSLGVENILHAKLLSECDIRRELNIPENKQYILTTFHPVTLEPGQELNQISALHNAFTQLTEYFIIFTGVNADHGGKTISEAIKDFACQNSDRVRFFDSLGTIKYLSAAKYASCVCGNSSSGIIEIPSFAVPVVNIGNRQQGRIASSAVIHCPAETCAIQSALENALSLQHKQYAKQAQNPYHFCDKSNKSTSEKIADIILNTPLDNILKKKFYDIVRQQ